jgi:hypothetical protein
MYLVGPEDNQIPLCLDCDYKHTQMLAMQNEQMERTLDYLASEMEMIVGLPGVLPRFPKRKVQILQGGNVTLNNIHVSASNIGVLNTGNLQMVDSAITILNQNPTAHEVSRAIARLTDAIAGSTELTPDKKNEAIEVLGGIATAATIPKEQRKTGIVKALLAAIPTSIQTAASVMQIWQQVEPIIKTFFQ